MKQVKELPDDVSLEVGGVTMSKADVLERLRRESADMRLSIIAQRDEWVRHRAASNIEAEWKKCDDLYHGRYDDVMGPVEKMTTSGTNKSATANRSRIVVNIIKPKVKQAVARMCEILLPTDEKNWGIKPTPIPSNVKKMVGDHRVTVTPDGQPNPEGATADAEAQRFLAEASEKCEMMERLIEDQLIECQYNASQRDLIANGVRLGTGILIGPLPRTSRSSSWIKDAATGAFGREEKSETVPGSVNADPWHCYFDPAPGKEYQNGAGFWLRTPNVTRKQLRELAANPSFDREAIQQVLLEAPQQVATAEGRVRRTALQVGSAYEMWTYHGEVEPETMRYMSLGTGDPLEDVEFGVLVMVNDRVIGTMPSWVVDKTLPVSVWNWTEREDSPFGIGMPMELEHQQRVVISAWRQVMDNGRYSVGSQIVMMRGVTPVDQKWEITPGKLWTVDPEKIGSDDVRKAMAGIDFPSHIGELLQICKTAQEMADQESNMPQLMAGAQGSAPESVGGTILLHQNAMAVLRMQVKLYDDNVTSPHIRRYYDYNMANSQDEAVKGDMEVDARGSSALLERDVQNQSLLQLAQVASNPKYQAFIDPEKELDLVLSAMRVLPDKVKFTPDRIKKNQEQPPAPDPRMQAAQISLEAKKMELALREKELQTATAQNELMSQERAADRQYNSQREQGEYTIAMTHEQNLRDLQQQRIAADLNITAQQLEANTGIKHLEIETKREIFNAEAHIKVSQGSGI